MTYVKIFYFSNLQTTSHNKVYQRKWSETYRKLQTDESNESLKERHSNFYHSSKRLRDLWKRMGFG